MTETTAEPTPADARLVAWWKFDEGVGDIAKDSSGNGHTLRLIGNPAWTRAETGGAIALNGADQYLQTDSVPLRTDDSLSIAAWLRLDSAVLGEEFALPPDWFALTAVSQPGPTPDSLTHSPFYLGVRAQDEETPGTVMWCLETAPVDGDPPGPPWPYVWENAFSKEVLGSSALDRWVFLVGVIDKENLTTHVHLPATGDHGSATLVDNWPFWQADAPLQIGRAYWRNQPVDQWHGSIGPVRLYQGVLTAEEAQQLYRYDLGSTAG
ncbi:LamG-like jellyroll fold domain-containing protein [Streptomyces mesophilus]|uniref:LamG-like jellyroll fold domain-containing protein n=1 Tax=Streptomyces mesophilus TaxID=1775132 RepID=UPI00332352A0